MLEFYFHICIQYTHKQNMFKKYSFIIVSDIFLKFHIQEKNKPNKKFIKSLMFFIFSWIQNFRLGLVIIGGL